MEKPNIENLEQNEGKKEVLKRKVSKALLTLFAGIAIGYSLDEMKDGSEDKNDTVAHSESENKVFDTARDELLKIIKESDPHLKESYKKAFENFDLEMS